MPKRLLKWRVRTQQEPNRSLLGDITDRRVFSARSGSRCVFNSHPSDKLSGSFFTHLVENSLKPPRGGGEGASANLLTDRSAAR